jgi:hypothetical protein
MIAGIVVGITIAILWARSKDIFSHFGTVFAVRARHGNIQLVALINTEEDAKKFALEIGNPRIEKWVFDTEGESIKSENVNVNDSRRGNGTRRA